MAYFKSMSEILKLLGDIEKTQGKTKKKKRKETKTKPRFVPCRPAAMIPRVCSKSGEMTKTPEDIQVEGH